jgi:cytochrome P450
MPVVTSPPPLDELLRKLFALEPELLRDPYPFYRRLREEAPVYFFDPGVAIVSTHELASTVFRDGERFHAFPTRAKNFEQATADLSDEEGEMVRRLYALEAPRLSNIHGERHRRVRSAAQRYFTPKQVGDLVAAVEQLVDLELTDLAERASGGVVDLASFADRVPLLVVMEIIGAPYEDADMVRKWGDARSRINRGARFAPEDVRAADKAMTEFREYVGDLIERQRGASYVSTLAAALLDAAADDQLAHDELVEIYLLLLFAGHDTTRNLITGGMRSLLAHRDQWELLCADPTLSASAVEELLRYDSVAQFFPRLAAFDLELGGVAVPRGAQLLVAIGAANRDPLVFDGPDELQVARKPNPHLAFGGGPHFCLGAPVSRMEGRIVLRAIAERFPRIDSIIDPAHVPFRPNETGRGPLALEVTLG